MDLSVTVNNLQMGPDGGLFAVEKVNNPVNAVLSGMYSVTDQKRRVEMKQALDKKKSVARKPPQPARRASLRKGKAGERARPETSTASTQSNQLEIKEELIADHELDILLDSFESETFTGILPIEPNSHGDDPSATDELWRRLSNTAWIRNPEATPDGGNSSTVTQR
jgi:hypothetical protein